MAYARSGPRSEVVDLRDEITREVNTDADHLARSIFPHVDAMPDLRRVPNETVDARYKAAYQANDRQWLQQEARRDPEQFLATAKRIGVTKPDAAPNPPTALPQPAAQLPESMPMVLPPTLPMAAAPSPVLPLAPPASLPPLPVPGPPQPEPLVPPGLVA